jgi:MFS family permease
MASSQHTGKPPSACSAFRLVGLAVVLSTVGFLPAMLIGGMAVTVQEELAFGETQLGAAIAAYFASAALAVAPAGRLAERLGHRVVSWLGLTCVGTSLLGIALVAGWWGPLVGLLAVGGIGHGLVQIGVSVLLVRIIAVQHQGLAFGVAQAAFPLSALLAGLSVPAIGLTLGWRWTFILGAAMLPLVAAMVPAGGARQPKVGRSGQSDTPIGTLVLLTFGFGLAAAGSTAGTSFIVGSVVERGFTPTEAGLVLAAGSLVAVTTRITVGWVADRLGRDALLLTALLLAVGAIGYCGLAFGDRPALMVLSVSLAFGGGWGWMGLWLLAISRANPVAPASAMGIAYVGPMAGSTIGPLVFGALAEGLGFPASWLVIAAMALTGGGTILVCRQRFIRAQPGLARPP